MSTSRSFTNFALIGSFAIVLYLMFRILQPFLLPMFLAVVLATLLEPLNQKLLLRLRGKANVSSLIICVGLTIVLVVPLVLLAMALAGQAGDLYKLLRDPTTLERLRAWADPHTNARIAQIERWLPASLNTGNIWPKISEQANDLGLVALGSMTAIAGRFFNFILDYFIVFFGLFFLLRDSNYFVDALKRISPLAEREELMFAATFREMTNAAVLGTLVTAIAQGLLSGIIYLILGLPNAVLWGTLTGMTSLIPLAGTALIWVPLTLYLLLIGEPYRALALLILEVAVVGSVDNVLRPFLIEGRVKMHTLVIFFSILGGIDYFGIFGVILGPLVFAVGLTFFELYLLRSESKQERI